MVEVDIVDVSNFRFFHILVGYPTLHWGKYTTLLLLTGSPSLSYTLVSHWCIRKTRATSEKCHFFDFFLFLPMFAHGKILQNFFYGPILTFEAGKDPLWRGHQPPVEIF